ncbi:hypothetical protein LAZ67_17000528 [Cordylochernes scorpioides]|uniref:Uncharacterized protein n=1 Tax=Cordylochernes scorpioides TaxID=51811 RepID=A0ABY6LGF3_9ARAC|nr:hypothetical protein LAZ67_17000528 [Cordylochernes scorpioides]
MLYSTHVTCNEGYNVTDETGEEYSYKEDEAEMEEEEEEEEEEGTTSYGAVARRMSEISVPTKVAPIPPFNSFFVFSSTNRQVHT